jgi:glycosyltransferase involved in cell wall biosynthesis/SAM-dependent methyltransferase
VLIPTRNEEANIAKCLDSLAWAEDIWVVDSNSGDRTAEIARTHGAQVVNFCWDGRGPRKKNWALEHLPFRHRWLLLLDADEEVTPELRDEITWLLVRGPRCAGYLVRYHYEFLGRRLRHGDPLWKMAFVEHHRARFERIHVPEVTGYDVELHEWLRVEGPVGRLRAPLLHRDAEDLHHFFDRHNTYSDWEALLRTRRADRDRSGEIRPRLFGSPVERRRWFKRLFLALPGRSFVYFFYSYLLRCGFLDGRAGLHYNLLKSFYWYQVRLKEYELCLRQRSMRRLPATPEGANAEFKLRRPMRSSSPEVEDGNAALARQLQFYRERVDEEEEITRPRGYPRPVQYLLEFKWRKALELLWKIAPANGSSAESVLVICGGSGMESEYLARRGFRVTALDISPEAIARARVRRQRFGVTYELLVGDAERLPFPDGSFDFVFVHDGLHHLPDAYCGVAEMLRVARRAIILAEPADAALTRLAVRLGISGKYEDAGNFVYRLDPQRLAGLFRTHGVECWALRRDLVYYQPWTFRFYRLFHSQPMFRLFQALFHVGNTLIGRWGNSLKAVAWKRAAPTAPPDLHSLAATGNKAARVHACIVAARAER